MELTIIVSIFLFVFGLAALISDEFKITKNRSIDSGIGRFLGIIMLSGAVIPFCIGGWVAFLAQWGSLALAIVIGISESRVIETAMPTIKPMAKRQLTGTLQRARESAQQGDKTTARRLLAQVIKADPRHETAWLWLSAVIDDQARKRECLERVMAINPLNKVAQSRLQRLDQLQQK